MSIGSNIKYYRSILGISQSELARRIGKTSGAVSQYESDTVTPRMPILERIADTLDVPSYKLLGTAPAYEYAVMRIDVTHDEEDLVELFRTLPKEKQEQLLRIARTL